MSEETELDKAIQQYITIKTPQEIGDLVGCGADEVIHRAYEMRSEIDAISIEVQTTFLIQSLNRIARNAERDAENAAGAKDKGGLYSAAVSAITQSLKQANILRKENNGAVVALNALRVKELLRLFDVIVERGVTEIVNEFDVPQARVKEIFKDNIVAAAKELEG